MEGTFVALEREMDAGRFLGAWRGSGPLGPPERWPAPARARVGARLVHVLGDEVRARRLALSAWREQPGHPDTRLAAERVRYELRGPFAVAWSYATKPPPESDEPDQRALSLSLHAGAYVDLGDAARVRALLSQLERIDEAAEEIALVRMGLARKLSRDDEALALSERAVEACPTSGRVVSARAQLLVLAGRLEDAAAGLAEAGARLERPDVMELLAVVLLELSRPEEAERWIRRAAEIACLAPEGGGPRHVSLRFRAAVLRGDFGAARELAARYGGEELVGYVDRLAAGARAGGARPTVLLPVPFVRQEELGCAPATLAAVARTLGAPTDHVEVADRITFHGTTGRAERRWALDEGFVVREGVVDWASAVALLDRGVPFVLSTQAPRMGHAQAVIGYDAATRELVLRDPFVPFRLYVDADRLFEQQRHAGPRGLALAPAGRAALLEGISLPHAARFDRLFALEEALERHDRGAAAAIADELRAEAPGDVVGRAARRCLAAYDGDAHGLAALARERIEADREDALAWYDLALATRATAPRAERLAVLEQAVAASGGHPALVVLHASELALDPGEHARVRRMLAPLLVNDPPAAALAVLGSIAEVHAALDQALALHRAASTVEPTSDGHARAFAAVGHARGRLDEVLAWLRERRDRFARRSGEPARLLADVLVAAGRVAEAGEALRAAHAERPEDGGLLRALVAHALSTGRAEEASDLVGALPGRVSRAEWLAARLSLAEHEGRPLAEQVELLREMVALDPWDVDALAALATKLERTEGGEVAADLLEAAQRERPHHRPTARLAIDRLRQLSPDRGREALDRLLALEPLDAWAHRERALDEAERGHLEAAEAALARAAELEPRHPSRFRVEAFVARASGDAAREARAWWEATALDPDSMGGAARLVELGAAASEAGRERLVRALCAQATSGVAFEGFLSALRVHAGALAARAAADALLRGRPDLFPAWELATRAALEEGDAAAARRLGAEALERFPLHAAAHALAFDVLDAEGDAEAARAALRRAVELSPRDARLLRLRVFELDRAGATEEADAVLARGRATTSEDPELGVFAAERCARRGALGEALGELAAVLRRAPDFGPALVVLSRLGLEGELAERRGELLRGVLASAPADLGVRLLAAQGLAADGDVDGALAALDAEPAPSDPEHACLDVAAQVLAEAGRWEEALRRIDAAFPPVGFSGAPKGPPIPPRIAVRRAEIVGEHQDLGGGVMGLEKALAASPGVVRGWEQLTRFLDLYGEPSRALEAARQLAARSPGSARGHVLQGLLALRLGQPAEAREAFARALAIDPSMELVAELQLDACLAAPLGVDLPRGAAALHALERFAAPAMQALAKAAWALAEGHATEAADRLEEAARAEAPPLDRLLDLAAGVAAADAGLLAARADALLGDGDAPEAAGVLYVAAAFARVGEASRRGVAALGPPRARAGARWAFFRLLGRRGASAWRILQEARGRASWGSDLAWGAPLAALGPERPLLALALSFGWRLREGLEPAALLAIGAALARVGLDARAHEALLRGARGVGLGSSDCVAWAAAYRLASAPVAACGAARDVLPPLLRPDSRALAVAVQRAAWASLIQVPDAADDEVRAALRGHPARRLVAAARGHLVWTPAALVLLVPAVLALGSAWWPVAVGCMVAAAWVLGRRRGAMARAVERGEPSAG